MLLYRRYGSARHGMISTNLFIEQTLPGVKPSQQPSGAMQFSASGCKPGTVGQEIPTVGATSVAIPAVFRGSSRSYIGSNCELNDPDSSLRAIAYAVVLGYMAECQTRYYDHPWYIFLCAPKRVLGKGKRFRAEAIPKE